MRPRQAIAPLLCAIALAAPIRLHGQRLTDLEFGSRSVKLPPIPSGAHYRFPTTNSPTTSGDHRIAGLVVGVLALGALGAWVGSESCHNQPTPTGVGGSQSCTGATLALGFAGGLVGGGLGYLLGRSAAK